MKKNIYYVYVYLDLDNIPFYVGKGKGSRYYISMHLDKNNSNRLLKNKIRKVGNENIVIEFILKNVCEGCALCCEIDLIATIGRRDLGLGTLCNLTDGGEGLSGHIMSSEQKKKISRALKGHKTSEETKQKISEANKGENNPWYGVLGENHPRYGKPGYWIGRKHTEESKRKMGEARKGKKLSKSHKLKISKAMKGKKVPEEVRRKISETMKRTMRRKKRKKEGCIK